jgi:hypothetical protein
MKAPLRAGTKKAQTPCSTRCTNVALRVDSDEALSMGPVKDEKGPATRYLLFLPVQRTADRYLWQYLATAARTALGPFELGPAGCPAPKRGTCTRMRPWGPSPGTRGQ